MNTKQVIIECVLALPCWESIFIFMAIFFNSSKDKLIRKVWIGWFFSKVFRRTILFLLRPFFLSYWTFITLSCSTTSDKDKWETSTDSNISSLLVGPVLFLLVFAAVSWRLSELCSCPFLPRVSPLLEFLASAMFEPKLCGNEE